MDADWGPQRQALALPKNQRLSTLRWAPLVLVASQATQCGLVYDIAYDLDEGHLDSIRYSRTDGVSAFLCGTARHSCFAAVEAVSAKQPL